MCGIVGYLGHRQATEVLVEGLSKLEYRGYDSAGVAVNTGNELEIRKFKGRLAILAEDLENNPINEAVNGTPERRLGIPKVNLGFPSIGSIPIVDIINPNPPEISPFVIDFVLAPAIIVNPNIDSQKYSAGPNFNARVARVGANKYNEIELSIPPIKEAITAVPKAFPAFPCTVSSYPSIAVAAAAGVPGVRISIADIDPPKIAPQYTPANTINPVEAGIPNVIGIRSATPMAADNPGRAPIVIPIATLTHAATKFIGLSAVINPYNISDIISSFKLKIR